MEFRKEPPTEPGNYWWRSSRLTPVMAKHVVHPHSQSSTLCAIEGNWTPIEHIGGEWGDRISPQPVPEEVVEAARWLQGWTADCCILGTEGLRYLRAICDHILPPPEPLPLPEQRRGVVYGYPCVASKSVDDDTWWVQWVDRDGNNQNQFFSEKCRDLKLDGTADA